MSTIATREGGRDYGAYMRCDAGDRWIPRAVDQIGSWLREKGWDVDLTVSATHERPGATLVLEQIDDTAGTDYRMALQESNETGEWATEVHLHDELGSHDWLTLAVRSGHGGFVRVPRLARYLMQVLPLGDGDVEFIDGRHQWGEPDVDALIDLLSDPLRHGLVFVAGTDDASGIPVDAFSRQVERWSREVVGLAQVVVLDPAGTAAFEAAVGTGFRAPSWTIRTYHPGVQFGDSRDARRHRILGTERLVSQGDNTTQKLLGDIARGHAAIRPTDNVVVRARRRLQRHQNRQLLDALAVPAPVAAPLPVAPTPVPDLHVADVLAPPSRAEIEVALVHRVLGITEITEDALLRFAETAVLAPRHLEVAHALQLRMTDFQVVLEQLEDQKSELVEALDSAQMETELVSLELDAAQARVQYLTEKLRQSHDYATEHTETPTQFENKRPRSFRSLLEKVAKLEEIEFTGDVSEVEKLNQIDTNDSALRVAWEAIIAIRDYIRARSIGDCSQGLAYYLEHTPSGYHPFPPGKFADTETGETMRRFGKERIFPVPTSIDPSGEIEMKAHFKLARIGMVSPRMHVYDGHPTEPRVFIGYIGPHLTNTQTR